METQPKTWTQGQKVFVFSGILILFLIIISLFQPAGKPKVVSPEEKAYEDSVKRREVIESKMSSWDGSHKELTEWVKNNLNDPGSYEHTETIFFDQDSVLIFKTFYTATNAFGGRVRGYAMARADSTGDLIEVIEFE